MSFSILVVGPAWVGDMVMSQTLFKLIKQNHPNAVIDVIAPDWTRALLIRMPEVRKAISLPLQHGELALKKRWAIGRALIRERYDQAIVLPNSFKSALIPFFAKIGRRTGWRGEWRYGLLNDVRVLDKNHYPLMIERFMALGLEPKAALEKPYPFPELVVDLKNREKTLQKHNLNTDKPILALCPGAEFGPSKRWPIEHFSRVAQTKLKQGYAVWLFGSKNDSSIADQVVLATEGQAINLAGKTTLDEAIDLLSLAKVVLTNDSGLMHIAASLNRPIVALYGSTSTDFTPPLGKWVKVLNLHLNCSPCFQRVCPLKHGRCLADLTPEMALSAMDDLEHESFNH